MLWWKRVCPKCGGDPSKLMPPVPSSSRLIVKRPPPPPAPPPVPIDYANLVNQEKFNFPNGLLSSCVNDRLRDLERRVTQLEAIEHGRRTAGQVMT